MNVVNFTGFNNIAGILAQLGWQSIISALDDRIKRNNKLSPRNSSQILSYVKSERPCSQLGTGDDNR